MSPPPAEPIPFPARAKPRVKKLRLLLVLAPLALLAVVSTVFGMLMAVAADVGGLENARAFQAARNSVVSDVHGRPVGILTSDEDRVIVPLEQVSPAMRDAIVSIEDRRFYANDGVDLRGISRAFLADFTSGKRLQGGSTIAQQFVKNALEAQDRRTLFQKLREAALAYHLAHRWSKDKILGEYLNTIYFGNGAYGIESAARTYFGSEPRHQGCGLTVRSRPCAAQLAPAEAALLAGMVASPTAFDPARHPRAARARRNLVLGQMLEQRRLTPAAYRVSVRRPLPTHVEPPRERAVTPATPYFTTWVRQQVVDRFGPQRAYEGGLRVQSTLDLDLQRAAEQAVRQRLWAGGPSAAIVVIDNATGGVRAMVGGRDYNASPFNVAAQGRRQPGSAFKPFTLAQALREGISPQSTWPSRKRVFQVPGSGERFVVNNYQGEYAGSSTLAHALATSDNSVFAAVGIKVGVARIARLAEHMGIRTRVSSNLATTLGGLRRGVTPLDMAHAYETLARGGERVTGTLGSPGAGPVGLQEVDDAAGRPLVRNAQREQRVLEPGVAHETAALMTRVVTGGTGVAAAVPGAVIAGKTGTTENYGDAWFVGFSRELTVAVWVGYPDKVRSMRTEYRGGPVAGGTYPAQIFHDFMTAALRIDRERVLERAARAGRPAPPPQVLTLPGVPVPAAPSPSPAPTPATQTTSPATPSHGTSSSSSGTGGGSGSGSGGSTGSTTRTTPSTSSGHRYGSSGTGGSSSGPGSSRYGGTGSGSSGSGSSGSGRSGSGGGTSSGGSGSGTGGR